MPEVFAMATQVFLGQPESVVDIDFGDVGDQDILVLDVNGRVGAASYLSWLHRTCPVKLLNSQQMNLLLRSVGLETNQAFELANASVDALRRAVPSLVSLMEKTGVYAPAFGWHYVKVPPVGIFLGAETLPDEFWDRVDKAQSAGDHGRYWIVGNPYQIMGDNTRGYGRLIKAPGKLHHSTAVIHEISHIVPLTRLVGESNGASVVRGRTLDEFRSSVEEDNTFGTVVVFKNVEFESLPAWVSKPRFIRDDTPTVARTLVDRFVHGDNEIYRAVLKTAWAGKSLRIKSEASCDLSKVSLDTTMGELIRDEDMASVSLLHFARSPWKYRYPTGSRIRAISVFSFVGGQHVAFAANGPWREQQRYKVLANASSTVWLLP